MKRFTPAREVAEEYLTRFPSAGSLTLARMLCRDHSALFKDAEHARGIIRVARGASGKNVRKQATQQRPLQSSGDPFAELPKGRQQLSDWEPFNIIPKCGRILVISDIHVPFHDDLAVRLALNHGKAQDVTHILINGDLMDCHSVSHWERDPRTRDFQGELDAGRLFLQVLRDQFPKARIVFKLGNHDEWLERYYSVKAPELLGVSDYELKRLLRCNDVGVEVVTQKRPVMAGKLAIMHGHEFAKGIAAPVNPARGFYMRAKDNILGGHFHQTSEHNEKVAVSGRLLTAWSTGCLCDMRPAYAPFNNWNHGFAIVDVKANGDFHVKNLRIYKGRIL